MEPAPYASAFYFRSFLSRYPMPIGSYLIVLPPIFFSAISTSVGTALLSRPGESTRHPQLSKR